MAENNKLSASSDYPLSDLSTEMNVSASLSNNDSTGNATTVTAANPPSNTPDLKNVQDLTRYVISLDIDLYFGNPTIYILNCLLGWAVTSADAGEISSHLRSSVVEKYPFLNKKKLFSKDKTLSFFLNLHFTWWYGKPYWWFRKEHCWSCHPIWSWRTTKIGGKCQMTAHQSLIAVQTAVFYTLLFIHLQKFMSIIILQALCDEMFQRKITMVLDHFPAGLRISLKFPIN